MTLQQGTATILQFPRGGKAGLRQAKFSSDRDDAQFVSQVSPALDWRDWYHHEAIRDASVIDRH